MAVNTITASGNVTRDANLVSESLLTFTIAVNNRVKNRETGSWEDDPCFLDCKVLGRRASALAGRIAKGSKLMVQGHMTQDRWKDRSTGENRSKLAVIVDELDFAESPRREMRRDANGSYNRTENYAPEPYSDDEIPF